MYTTYAITVVWLKGINLASDERVVLNLLANDMRVQGKVNIFGAQLESGCHLCRQSNIALLCKTCVNKSKAMPVQSGQCLNKRHTEAVSDGTQPTSTRLLGQ